MPKFQIFYLFYLFLFLAYRIFSFILEQSQRNVLKLPLSVCAQTNVLQSKAYRKKIKVSFNKMQVHQVYITLI